MADSCLNMRTVDLTSKQTHVGHLQGGGSVLELLSTEWLDYVEEPMKYQALRPHFFSVVGGWRVLGVDGWWWGGSWGGCVCDGGVGGCWLHGSWGGWVVVMGWVMGCLGGGCMGHGVGGWWWCGSWAGGAGGLGVVVLWIPMTPPCYFLIIW